MPTEAPTDPPTAAPTAAPTVAPTAAPTAALTTVPTAAPTDTFPPEDTAGFGASAYNTSTCENAVSAWSVGAGFAAGPNLYATAGTIWVR